MNSGDGSSSRSTEVSNPANTDEVDRGGGGGGGGGRRRYTGEFIEDEKSRVMTYRRRNKGLKKKIYELSTLCDVDACMIMYGPEHRNHEPVLDTWPENKDEVNRILGRYFVSDEVKRGRVGAAGLGKAGRESTEEEIDVLRKRNEMMESMLWDSQIDALSEDQLRELLERINLKSEMVDAKLEGIERNQDLSMEVVRNG